MTSPTPPEQRVAGNQNVVIGSIRDSTVTINISSGPRLEMPLEPAAIELPPDMSSPGHLLRARYGVVPYRPPGDLVERLATWSHDGEPFALRAVAGAAGAGKTRIAVELCRTLSELGWLTGLLKAHVDPTQLAVLADAPTARLVVVDYAETRQEQLAEVLPILAGRATAEHPVRVLLTVRVRAGSRQDVRRVLSGRGDALDVEIHRASVDLVSELPFGEAERADLFERAVASFAGRLGRDAGSARRLLPELPLQALTSALLVLTAGYLAVADGRVPGNRAELLEGLLAHEDRYWSRSLESAGIGVTGTLRRRVVALATLAGAGTGESETSAARLLRLVPDLADANERHRRELARWVRGLYQGPGWWNPVEPDLVGEHLVAAEYGDEAEVLAGVLVDRPPDALVHPLRLLARAARDHPALAEAAHGVVTARLADLCQAAIDQASGADAPRLLQAGTTIAGALEPLVSLVPPEPWGLAAVLNGFPASNTVRWPLELTLTGQLVEHLRRLALANPAVEPNLAAALTNAGRGLARLGRREEALRATEEALEIRRRLAAADLVAGEPDLASALDVLGMRLSELGRREDALQATEEAVEIRRRLAASDAAAFEPDLSATLNNLSGCLSDLGRREYALQVIEEAVEIRRRLAAANPAAFEPDLAGALDNLGSRLSDLGRREEAVVAAEKAVEIRGRLAAANPAAFEPDLARSLNNLGVRLSGLGRRDEALRASEESVAIRRRLAAANPAAFEPDLAVALGNLAADLSALDRPEDALRATEESVEIRRRLAAANPAAFEPDLASALSNLSASLSERGRREAALGASEEAVVRYRRLAAARPTAFEPGLARALNNLGLRLSEVGRHEEALRATAEVVEVRRRLAGANPAAFEPDLARGLWAYAWVRAACRTGLEEALTAVHEAVGIYGRLARRLPAAFTDDLAGTLHTLADVLQRLGRAGEAAEIRRRLGDGQ